MDYILNRSQINYILSNNSLLKEPKIKNIDDGIIKESYNINNIIQQEFIRKQLKSIYEPLGMWGRSPDPNNDCQTNLGVIGVYPHSENDVWSVLNRFDTNIKVKNEIEKLFKDTNPLNSSNDTLINWIEKNREDLFGVTGKYTQKLVDIVTDTIKKGNEREEYAVQKLQSKFPSAKIKRYCAGHIHDTKRGIDLTVELPTISFNVQVKPFIFVKSYFEPDGDTFFEVKSIKFRSNNYSEKNVKMFMFVNIENNQYILFKNNKNKIGNMNNDITRFYDPPLDTNITFEDKKKRQSKKFKGIYDIFGVDTNLEKNLEFRIKTLQKLLQDLRNIKK